MTLPEIFLLLEANRPKMRGDYAGNLTQGDVDDLRDWIDRGMPREG